MMNLTSDLMNRAFNLLSQKLDHPVRLIIGGGGAMILAHHFSLVTEDVDGIPSMGSTFEELAPQVYAVAEDLGIPTNWLNPYYSTYMHVLPTDYGTRLIVVFDSGNLQVQALSTNDLLIMKCFAARLKDRTHAIALLKAGADIRFVENHIESLKKRNIPGTERALDFLDEVREFG